YILVDIGHFHLGLNDNYNGGMLEDHENTATTIISAFLGQKNEFLFLNSDLFPQEDFYKATRTVQPGMCFW
ncbi:hypothetical protein ACJX0J_036915, partial [Zea mays]